MSAAVYRHFSKNDELLYVGYSTKPLDRNLTHRSQAVWFKEIAKITIEWFDSIEDAQKAEVEAIQRECPRENVKDKPDDLFKRIATRVRYEPLEICRKPHAQLDAVERTYGIEPLSWYFFQAGFNTERLNEIRESGRELLVSEVSALRRSLETTFKRLEQIGLHRRNQG